jgi:hypothetical protein
METSTGNVRQHAPQRSHSSADSGVPFDFSVNLLLRVIEPRARN